MVNQKLKWKIIFIAPATSQPRYHKRVTQLLKFCDVEVFAFTRGLYEENTFPPNIALNLLGHISFHKYFRRTLRLILAIFKIRKHVKDKKSHLFYVLSFDCMIIARLCGLKCGFYEIGDLRQTERFGKALSFLEKLLFRNVLALVLTSSFFYEDFYKKKGFIPKENIFIIDNKVNSALARKRPGEKKISHGKIVIGLIGLLRYKLPIELLLEFVRKRPEFYVIECFGDGPFRGLVESYSCENIRYHGSFKNPEDVPNIYSQIDLNYVVYDNSNINVQLAIPNKFFESAYFGVPILCCQGTSVGKMAVEWQIGKMLRIGSSENFEEDLKSIDIGWIKKCSKNCLKIASSKLLDTGEQILSDMFDNISEAK